MPVQKKVLYAITLVVFFFFAAELFFLSVEKKPPTVEFPESPISMQYVPEPCLEPNPSASRLNIHMQFSDRLSSLAYPKPGMTYRVYIFGGSAALGLGFPYNGAFGRWLERMLTKACPGWNIEVINLSGVAHSSTQVRKLAMEVFEKGEPDLMVVYSGNNEFLESKASVAMEKAKALFANRLHIKLKSRFALVRFIEKLLPAYDSYLAKNRELDKRTQRILSEYIFETLNEEQIDRALRKYEENLNTVSTEGLKRNVPVVFCSLISNPIDNLFTRLISIFHYDLSQEHINFFIPQAYGWLRLKRWDKAKPLLVKVFGNRLETGLLRVFEEGGVRGIGRLAPPVRSELNQLAIKVSEKFSDISGRGDEEVFSLALSYHLLGKKENLRALVQNYVNFNGPATDKGHAIQRAIFAQFLDEKLWNETFYELWLMDTGFNKATPITNRIVRKTALNSGAILADTEKELPDWLDPSPLRYLNDYCHFNIEGAFETAALIYRKSLMAGVLPKNTKQINFRKSMLEPDLHWLQTKAHDFTDRDKWMGFDFRPCFTYCKPHGQMDRLKKWALEDAANYPDKSVAEAFTKNRHWYESRR